MSPPLHHARFGQATPEVLGQIARQVEVARRALAIAWTRLAAARRQAGGVNDVATIGQEPSDRALLPIGTPFRCVAPYQCILYDYDDNLRWNVKGFVAPGAVVTAAPPPPAPQANVIGPWMLVRGPTSLGVREGWVLRRDVVRVSLDPRVLASRRGIPTTLSLPTGVLR